MLQVSLGRKILGGEISPIDPSGYQGGEIREQGKCEPLQDGYIPRVGQEHLHVDAHAREEKNVEPVGAGEQQVDGVRHGSEVGP